MKKTKSIIQLARPVNVLISMLSIFIGAAITGVLEPLENILLASFSGGLITAASNSINDYFDMEIDRINKPHRPLPSGAVSRNQCLTAALTEYMMGIGLSLFISAEMFIVALIISILTFLYAARLKGTVLWGNLTVSFCTAAAFIYGGLSVNKPLEAIVPACFAFFYHFGREIIKDIQDVSGDSQQASNTMPVRFGVRPSVFLVWFNFLILIVLTIIPYWTGWYGATYFLIVFFGIYPVIIYTLVSILYNTTPKHLGFVSNLLKADMLIGLLAVYLR
ncbi:MAG: geranylgeranylglycerol-phosphate geranylgeranyltransferase [Calditrichia bacterium]